MRVPMTKSSFALAFTLAALTAAPIAAQAQAPFPAGRAAAAPADRERDRQSILAMAGDYKVRFDMRETISFVQGYKPLEPKVSGGYESVRVVEDAPGRVVLQHLLVATVEGKPMVIKHWRQDWVYEPATVLTYDRANHWTLTPVSAADRKGAWSQTVWQTDDSPRYGGVGRWEYADGVTRWTSNETWRPLARRDATRKPPYDHYVGANRHALTPNGWVHEQDNAKVGMKDGKSQTYAHEVVLNTYEKFSGYDVAAGDKYWNATKSYWAAVRTAWDKEIAAGKGVAVTEEAQNGSVTGPKLMGLADDVAEGKTTEQAAVTEAQALIRGSERTRPLAAD
ncbi:MAG: hypothetical protein BGN86_00685 [Caulobacterales bacterium 68-7]|nr:MAG: hypothetical protein BGN86_00685 [Caulobacterales bacterium 68-7]